MKRAAWSFVAPLLVAGLFAVALQTPLPYFTEEPGTLFALSPRVQVDGYPNALHGDVLFGTVNVQSADLGAALRAAVDGNVNLIRRERLLPEGLDAEAFFVQQRAEFELASDVAAAVALRAAGFAVETELLHGEGALVLRVQEGGPVEHVLLPGDVVTAVDGRAVTTQADWQALLNARGRQPITLTITRARRTFERSVTAVPGRDGTPYVGLQMSTFKPSVTLPVAVTVDINKIGGPSAGLAVALTVFDRVVAEDLLAGRKVAATGSIDATGTIGTIGGADHKAVAAHRAGLDLLLVPYSQREEAQAALPKDSRLEIRGVKTFDDAIAALRETA